MILFTRHRLLSRGDLPNSEGGIYNPGAWVDAEGLIRFVCRVESDYLFQPQSIRPCSFVLLNETRTLTRYEKPMIAGTPIQWTEHLRLPYGFDDETRFEDLRPFAFQDSLFVAGVKWNPSVRPVQCKPELAAWVYPAQMVLWDEWDLTTPHRPMEKNWVLLEKDGRLHTIYSLSPLVIFRRTPYGEWPLALAEANDWEAEAGAFIKNSTHLLPFRGGYLGWWHVLRQPTRTYETGAYWLDGDLQLKARTGTIFDGREIVAAPDIYKPGVLYISSQVLTGADVLLFYGEGDSHSGVATLKQDDLARELGI